jgi:thiosulfate dehydrogenase
MRGFFFGVVTTLAVLVVGGYLCVRAGCYSLAVNAPMLPFEEQVADMALEASMGNAAQVKNPLPFSYANMLTGARLYRENCAGCHGAPGKDNSMLAKAMFPHPPQFFTREEMMTGDPEGELHWVVRHGIRLSGMPSFDKLLTEMERWQVTMLVKHADQLPAAAHAELVR